MYVNEVSSPNTPSPGMGIFFTPLLQTYNLGKGLLDEATYQIS